MLRALLQSWGAPDEEAAWPDAHLSLSDGLSADLSKEKERERKAEKERERTTSRQNDPTFQALARFPGRYIARNNERTKTI